MPWRWHPRPLCTSDGPAALDVKLVAGHGAGRERKPRPGCLDAAMAQGRASRRPCAWGPWVVQGRGQTATRSHPTGLNTDLRPAADRHGGVSWCGTGSPGRRRVRLLGASPLCLPSHWVTQLANENAHTAADLASGTVVWRSSLCRTERVDLRTRSPQRGFPVIASLRWHARARDAIVRVAPPRW